jgi:hypothetical protein
MMTELAPAEANRVLRNQLKRYRLDHALQLISRLAIVRANRSFQEQLTEEQRDYLFSLVLPHQLPYIAKALIQLSNDYRAAEMRTVDYFTCARLYNSAQGLELDDVRSSDDMELMFLRMQHQQFPYQRRQWPDFPRTLALYQDVASRSPFTQEFNIPDAFKTLTGLSVERFMSCGLGLWGKAIVARHANFEPWTRTHLEPDSQPMLDTDRFLATVVADYKLFRDSCSRFAPTNDRFEFYALNPLELYPIIRTDRSGLVIPVPEQVLSRVTIGLYYQLLDAYGIDFTNTFGLVFQEYVGELLRWVWGNGQLYSEFRYGRRKDQQDSIDWILVEDDTAVLIECKITRLSMQSKVLADPSQLEADVQKLLVRAVKQLHRFIKNVRSHVAGLESFSDISSFVPVVVVLDPFHGANSPPIRKLVESELRRDAIENFEYQVISVDELEPALPVLKEKGFARTLLEKINADASPGDHMRDWSFESYMGRVAPVARGARHPLLAKYWNQVGDPVEHRESRDQPQFHPDD